MTRLPAEAFACCNGSLLGHATLILTEGVHSDDVPPAV